MLDTLHEPLDELAKASESEDELDPLGCMRKLLIHLFHQVALDPKTRRINEILFHKCEFTDEMCDLRQQRRTASLECNLRIGLTLRNAVNRGQLPEDLDTARAAISIHAYIDGLLYTAGCWPRTVLNCTPKPSAGSRQDWICCAGAPACANETKFAIGRAYVNWPAFI
jgi:hypothetical protein